MFDPRPVHIPLPKREPRWLAGLTLVGGVLGAFLAITAPVGGFLFLAVALGWVE